MTGVGWLDVLIGSGIGGAIMKVLDMMNRSQSTLIKMFQQDLKDLREDIGKLKAKIELLEKERDQERQKKHEFAQLLSQKTSECDELRKENDQLKGENKVLRESLQRPASAALQ